MQGETALVGADVERLAMGIAGRGGVVQTLVKKGSGLLPGIGVVVKCQPIEMEDRPQLRNWLSRVERRLRRLAQLLQLAYASIRPLHDGDRGEFRLEDLDDRAPECLPDRAPWCGSQTGLSRRSGRQSGREADLLR